MLLSGRRSAAAATVDMALIAATALMPSLCAVPPERIPNLERYSAIEWPAFFAIQAVVPGMRRLGAGYHVFSLPREAGSTPHEGEIRRVAIRLPDGAMFAANLMPDQHMRPFWGGPWMMTVLFAVISVTLLGLWAAWALTALAETAPTTLEILTRTRLENVHVRLDGTDRQWLRQHPVLRMGISGPDYPPFELTRNHHQ